MTTPACRLCSGKLLDILTLGNMPIVNYFPTEKEFFKQKMYPLTFCVCERCGLSQIKTSVTPEQTFRNYYYLSEASQPLALHLKDIAGMMVKEFNLTLQSMVLDIGSNDGVLIEELGRNGVRGVGIDPSSIACSFAKKKGLEVIEGFFDETSVRKLKRKYGLFDVVVMTHTLANIPDLRKLFDNLTKIMKLSGKLVLEVASVDSMLRSGEFDAIYHEHYTYFSVRTIRSVLSHFGFTVLRVEKNVIQGESLFVVAEYTGKQMKLLPVTKSQLSIHLAFAKKAEKFRETFRNEVRKIGKPLIGIGAPAKAVTLLLYCGMTKEQVRCIVDSTVIKQGRVLPGAGIPILSMSTLLTDNPEYLVLLAWSYRQHILSLLPKLLTRPVHVLIPFPKLEILRIEPALSKE